MNRTDQAASERLTCWENPARHHPLLRLAHADRAGQEPAGAPFHHHRTAGKDHAEAGILTGEPHVEGQLHGHAKADSRAVDHTDPGLLRIVDAQGNPPTTVTPRIWAFFGRAAVAVERGSPAGKVRACTEGPASARYDHRAYRVVGVNFVCDSDQLINHHGIDGI